MERRLVGIANLVDLFTALLSRFDRVKEDQQEAGFADDVIARVAAELAPAGENRKPIGKLRCHVFVNESAEVVLGDVRAVLSVRSEVEFGAGKFQRAIRFRPASFAR